MALAREHGLVVIEDAAQAPGRDARRPLGGHARPHRRLQPQLPQDDPVRRGRRRGHRRRRAGRAAGARPQPRRGRRRRHGLRRHRRARLQLPHGRARGGDRRGPARAAGRADRAADRPRRAVAEALAGLEGITPPPVPRRRQARLLPARDAHGRGRLGVSRAAFAAALAAEGVPVTAGYVTPLYRQPLYRERAAGVRDPRNAGLGGYEDGSARPASACTTTRCCSTRRPRGPDASDVDDVIAAFRKVHGRARRALRLLVAAHDAGGAELLAAWLRRMEHDGACLDGPARAVFARRLPRPRRARRPSGLRPRRVRLQRVLRARERASSGRARGGGALRRLARPLGQLPGALRARRRVVLPDELWVTDEHAARLAARPSRGRRCTCAATRTSRTRRPRFVRSSEPHEGEHILYVSEPTSVAASA